MPLLTEHWRNDKIMNIYNIFSKNAVSGIIVYIIYQQSNLRFVLLSQGKDYPELCNNGKFLMIHF